MKSLIITAHPSSEGFSHKIAERYAKACKSHGGTSSIHNLYTDWKQDFFSYETEEEMRQISPLTQQIQNEIVDADEIILCFPLWWYEAPAILKNFIDTNLTARFAYHFEKSGMIKGHLMPRKVRLFITSGGPSWIYNLGILPCAKAIRKTLGNCGLKVESVDVFGPNRHRTPEQHEAWLKKVESRAK